MLGLPSGKDVTRLKWRPLAVLDTCEARINDFDYIISSKATFLHLLTFRYAIFDLYEPVEKVVSRLMRSLFDETQPQNSSRLLGFKIELGRAPLDLKSRMRLELKEYVKTALAGTKSQSRRRVQIGVVVEVTREAQAELEKVAFERWLMEEECVICLNKYDEENDIRRMPCRHIFHENCIFKWLRESRSCPMCRFKLSS